MSLFLILLTEQMMSMSILSKSHCNVYIIRPFCCQGSAGSVSCLTRSSLAMIFRWRAIAACMRSPLAMPWTSFSVLLVGFGNTVRSVCPFAFGHDQMPLACFLAVGWTSQWSSPGSLFASKRNRCAFGRWDVFIKFLCHQQRKTTTVFIPFWQRTACLFLFTDGYIETMLSLHSNGVPAIPWFD